MKERKIDDLIIDVGTLFYLSSIFGYIYELFLCFIYDKRILSHGFFKGPWLPIYGFGSLLVMLLYKYKSNLLFTFLASYFISGLFEGVSGFLLLKLLKVRLWDYTGYLFNIGGFVCFLSALCFAFGSLLIIYVIYPLIVQMRTKLNKQHLLKALSLISLFFMSDVIATILK